MIFYQKQIRHPRNFEYVGTDDSFLALCPKIFYRVGTDDSFLPWCPKIFYRVGTDDSFLALCPHQIYWWINCLRTSIFFHTRIDTNNIKTFTVHNFPKIHITSPNHVHLCYRLQTSLILLFWINQANHQFQIILIVTCPITLVILTIRILFIRSSSPSFSSEHPTHQFILFIRASCSSYSPVVLASN